MNWNGTSHDLLSEDIIDLFATKVLEKLRKDLQPTQSTEKILVDSRELATLLSVSQKFIEKHRHSILGAVKVGGVWRFDLQLIRARIASGRDIIIPGGR